MAVTFKPKRKLSLNPFTITIFVILAMYTLALVLFLSWGFLTSVKDHFTDFRINTFGFPKTWKFTNYMEAFSKISLEVKNADGSTRLVFLGEMFVNSILYSLGASVCQTIVTIVMAYLVAKYNNIISKIIYAIVIVTMVLPIVGSLPSEINVAKTLGIFGTITGVWLMRCSFLGLYFLVFYSMFKGISQDFDEAARIDGASNWRIMTEVNFPLVKNTTITVLLLSFIGYWNDYSIPMIYLPNNPTVATGLYYYNISTDATTATVPMKLTGCMLVVIPILILFIIFNDRVMGNITAGGIKE